MQTDEVEFGFTLNTPSLMTPNIVLNAPPFKSNVRTNNENATTSNSSSTTTNQDSLTASSADVKVSKIEDELKQSFSEPRRPTPSPFQKISSTNVFNLEKPTNVITTEDGSTVEIPSTADVRKRFLMIHYLRWCLYESFFFVYI
jgi:hypothetical protein